MNVLPLIVHHAMRMCLIIALKCWFHFFVKLYMLQSTLCLHLCGLLSSYS